MNNLAIAFYEFGGFRLDIVKRLLLRDGEAVPLTPKAFELLLVLIENNERVLEKSELMEWVWPNSFVEETNLTQNISTLRKALGESPYQHQFIITVPGRGYRFVADVVSAPDNESDLLARKITRSQIVGNEIVESESAVDAGTQSRPQRSAARQRKRKIAWIVLLVVIATSLALSLLLIGRKKSASTGTAIKTIAVLPFKPINASARDEYFELGMADALITKLSGLRQVIVRPTTCGSAP